MEGVLRRVTGHAWHGTLSGYAVHVYWSSAWHFAVIHPRGFVTICPRVASLAEGARRAREWVERNPLPSA
jgi:hypothetical protein